MDAVTDMADFVYNVEERETQVTFSDRFLEDMMYSSIDSDRMRVFRLRILRQSLR